MSRGPTVVTVYLSMSEAAALVDKLYGRRRSNLLAEINDRAEADTLVRTAVEKIEDQLLWVRRARRTKRDGVSTAIRSAAPRSNRA